mgnify:CR=1 FL=1
MIPQDMIEVTKEQIPALIKGAYDLSEPVGMGALHFTPEPLTDEEVKDLINEDSTVHMDYVKGRQCKFSVFKDKDTDKFYIRNKWFDHSDMQLEALLKMATGT